MKNSARTSTLAAMTIAVSPLVSLARNIAGQIGSVDRTSDVTLLPGPNLLSPARHAPQAGDSISISPASSTKTPGTFRFIPSVAKPSTDTLSLGQSNVGILTFSPEGSRKNTRPMPLQGASPHPDSLRFESTLPALPRPLTLEGQAAPKRD